MRFKHLTANFLKHLPSQVGHNSICLSWGSKLWNVLQKGSKLTCSTFLWIFLCLGMLQAETMRILFAISKVVPHHFSFCLVCSKDKDKKPCIPMNLKTWPKCQIRCHTYSLFIGLGTVKSRVQQGRLIVLTRTSHLYYKAPQQDDTYFSWVVISFHGQCVFFTNGHNRSQASILLPQSVNMYMRWNPWWIIRFSTTAESYIYGWCVFF